VHSAPQQRFVDESAVAVQSDIVGDVPLWRPLNTFAVDDDSWQMYPKPARTHMPTAGETVHTTQVDVSPQKRDRTIGRLSGTVSKLVPRESCAFVRCLCRVRVPHNTTNDESVTGVLTKKRRHCVADAVYPALQKRDRATGHLPETV
jgi:hypothetical protein